MDSQLKKPSTNSVGNWSPDEDEIILQYVYEKGKLDEHMMWGNLSETLNGRSGKSCRERWFNHLDPKIKRTEWSQAEQWVLFILRNQNGEKWSLISKKLMGRTDNAVKNYWNSRLKKRIDSMQHAVEQHFQRKGKQKIALMLQRESQVSLPPQDNMSLADQERLLSAEQKAELDAYLERSRAEYLQRILEQVNQQNIDYFENLCCEYSLQKQRLEKRQYAQDNLLPDANCPLCQGVQLPNGKICECLQRKLMEQENEAYEEVDHNLPFMNKLSIINMHLEILYKSVLFLDPVKITTKLMDYRKVKQLKRRQEQEWQAGQPAKKRNRMIIDARPASSRDRSPSIEDQPEICQEIDETHSVLSNEVIPKSPELPKDPQTKTAQSPGTQVAAVAPKAQVTQSVVNVDKNDANLTKQALKPSNEADSVSRNLRRRDNRTIQDQASSKSKPIRKLRNMNKGHRRFSNTFDRDEVSDGEPSNEDYKQLLKDQRVKSSPKNAVLRKILQTMAKQRRQAQTINKIFEATKEESVGRSVGPANVVDPALFKTDSNVYDQNEDEYYGSQNEFSSDDEPISPSQNKNYKELKLKHYAKKKASVHHSNSKSQTEDSKLGKKLQGRKVIKSNVVAGKRLKSKQQPEKGQNQIPKTQPQDNQNIIISQFNSAEINKMLLENKLQNSQVFHERMLPPAYYQEMMNQQQMQYPQGMAYPTQVITNQAKVDSEGAQGTNSQNCNIHNINIQRVVQNYYINTHDSNSSGSYAPAPNFQINQGPFSHQMPAAQGFPPQPAGFQSMPGQFYPQPQGHQLVMQPQFSTPEAGRPHVFVPSGFQASMDPAAGMRPESDIIARDSIVSNKTEDNGSQLESKKDSGSMKAAASRGKRTGSSTNDKLKSKKKQIQKNFTTKQFMNLTMTQVYQGRDREVNPMFKRKSAFQSLLSSNKPMSPQTTVRASSPNQASPIGQNSNSNQTNQAMIGPQSSLISPKRVQNQNEEKERETPSFAKNMAYSSRRDSIDEPDSAVKNVSLIQLSSVKGEPDMGAKLSPKVRELMTNIHETGQKSPMNDLDNTRHAQTEVKQKQKRVEQAGRKLFGN